MDSQLVSDLIKFNAQSNGRDKACRLFQYGCRLVWGQLQTKGASDTIQTLKNIEYMFSMTRKLLRFGKSLDFIQAAMKSIHLKDPILRLSITLAKINQAFYLLFDHFLWFNNVGLVKLNKQYWSEVSSKFYLTTLVLNLIRDIYGIWSVIMEETRRWSSENKRSHYKNGDTNHEMVPNKRSKTIVDIVYENHTLLLDTTKNLFDLAIPMSTLGMVKLSPRRQGIYGLISSYIAVVTVWNPKYKLVPS